MEIEHPFIITTRPEEKYQPLSGSCFEVVNIPVTEVHISNRIKDIKNGLIQFNPHIIVLTSSTGSDIFMNLGLNGNYRFICIGEKTALPLRNYGLKAEVPEEMNSYGLVDYIKNHVSGNERIALCRSKQHDNYLDEYLDDTGYVFKDFPLYSLKKIPCDSILSYIERKNYMGIVFTSSLETKIIVNFLSEKGKLDLLNNKSVFSIGKMTSKMLKKYGIQTESMNSESNFEAIIKEISDKYCNSGEWI